jgi:uncharacterized protein (DUF433 family)
MGMPSNTNDTPLSNTGTTAQEGSTTMAVVDEQASRDELVGVPARSAARIASVSLRRLQHWEQNGLVQPSVRRDLSKRNVVRIYAFDQLVELLVVRELEDRKMHVRHIRAVVEKVRGPEYSRPLSQLRWAVGAGKIYFQHSDGTWGGEERRGQTVMEDMLDLDRIRAAVREGVRKIRANNSAGQIEKRRGVVGSKPVFEGTRTPVAAVQVYLRRGIAPNDILKAFPHLSLADVQAAQERLGAA